MASSIRVGAVMLSYPPLRYVGSELTTHEYLKDLQRAGISVRVYVHDFDHTRGMSYDGVDLYPVPTAAQIAAECDIVLTHPFESSLFTRVFSALSVREVPLVMFVHSAWSSVMRSVLRDPDSVDLFVYNSEDTRSYFDGLLLDRDPERDMVVNPPLRQCVLDSTGVLDPFAPLPSRPEVPTVTLINPIEFKGVNTVAAVATLFPQYRYLVVPGGYGKPNLEAFDEAVSYGASVVTYPHQLDPCSMDDIYAQTSVLMVPSHNESWGSVGLEALAHGVPVVASGLPGVMEALGDLGRYAGPLNFEETARLVREAMEMVHPPIQEGQDPDAYSEAYREFITGTRAHVAAFTAANVIQRRRLVNRIIRIAERALLSRPEQAPPPIYS